MLAGKLALVTGGASGIGAAAVRRLTAEGAACVIADIQSEPGQALAAEIGAAARFVATDVTVEADVAGAVDAAVAVFGKLDCMFNNAGILGAVGPIAETTLEAWERTTAVLLRGAFLGIKHAARVMTPRGAGSIITTGSTASVLGGFGPHAYTAAKHGIVGLTKSAAAELGRSGVRVNCVAPGAVVTALTQTAFSASAADPEALRGQFAATSPLGRAVEAEDIAAAVAFLASGDARSINGHCLMVDAGATSAPAASRFVASAEVFLGAAGQRGL